MANPKRKQMKNDEWHPGRLLEVSGSYWRTCALHAGVKLDIFTGIGDEALTAPELAKKLGTDEDGTARLLDALTAMALLSKKDGQYRNTPTSRACLSKDSDRYIGHMILHHHHLMESWSRLEQLEQQSGKPYFTVLRARVDQPRLTTRQLHELLADSVTGIPAEPAFRVFLHRCRKRFASILLQQVIDSLQEPTNEDIELELIELGLHHFCKPAMGN